MPDTPQPPSPTTLQDGRSDPLSAMTPRFNLPFRWFARRYFRHLGFGKATVERLAATIKRYDPRVVRSAKQAVTRGLDQTLEQGLEIEARLASQLAAAL